MRPVRVFGRIVCTFIGLLLIAGCTQFRAELKPSPPQIAAKQPVPIVVGAYFPEALRKYEATYEWRSGDPLGELLGGEAYIFPVGNASVPLLQDATRLVFDKVLVVEGIASPGMNPALRAILSFEIAKVNIFHGRGFGAKSSVEVTYRIRAYDREAREELTWTVTGTAVTELSPSLRRPPPHLTQAVEMAMRDAAEKFVLSFHELPEVQRWLENLKNS